MSVLQRYFHTFHHLPPPNHPSHILPKDMSLEAISILFCANEQNLSLFMQCESFTKLLPMEAKDISEILDSILDMQGYLLMTKPHILSELQPYFVPLNLHGVINDEEFRCLMHLKNAHLQEQLSALPMHNNSADIKQLRQRFYMLYEEALNYATSIIKLSPDIESRLKAIRKRLENGRLSIGVTGVLSAGKSTFLNALLSQEVLGSSNIPETANLTILRYGEDVSARVHFWGKREWQQMREESRYDMNLQAFISECEAHFGTELDRLITEPHLTKEILSSEISDYTSANSASKLCHLVQKVELFMPLAFLQNDVEIVDTPGLDDPITKREDITRAYIEHCDMLIHVMNASCAATQKDIDFILESLLEQNISRLLVVLTRIDLLSENELTSALEYTKSSLIAQLQKANYKGDITSLINRIDFMPLAGYAALLHRTNAKTDGISISLEQSGILDIELYLQSTLLGDDSLKAKDMLYLAYKALHQCMQEVFEQMALESALKHANKEELERILAQEEAANQQLLQDLESLQSHLHTLLNELKMFLSTLETLSANALHKNAEILQTKIFEDMMYDYKRGSKPDVNALHKMIELSLKDGFADMSREYRYKLSRKMIQIHNHLQTYSEDSKLPSIHFELKNSEIMAILQPLFASLASLIASAKKGDALHQALEHLFNTLFESFGTILEYKNNEINAHFLAYFDDITAMNKNLIHHKITQKQAQIQAILSQRSDIESDIESNGIKADSISHNAQIESIINECANAIKALS